ncbi:unnamed protein product, partial [marine sediment metagenome]
MKIRCQFFKKIAPFLVLLTFETILFLVNYTQGTFLVGWDNLYPELNFAANLKRNIFAVWQEYRGLGLLDGMAHAANLPHTLFLWLLSLFFPLNLLRYIFIFLMHFLGGLGVFVLLKEWLFKNWPQKTPVSLAGALFYLLNLTTVQM